MSVTKPRILVLEGLSRSASCVRAAGGSAVSVRPTDAAKVDEILESKQLDGLLLTGGGDVSPRLYGRKPHKKVYGVDELRDACEQYALAACRDFGLPVLGICRGHQMINVEAGGKLIQHIGGHYGRHPVRPDLSSKLHKAVGYLKKYEVTSYHHQAVREVAPGFRVAARALDGTIESIESDDGRVIGVQYHPEMDRFAAASRSIFRWLVEEACARSTRVEKIAPSTAVVPFDDDGWDWDSLPKYSTRRRGGTEIRSYAGVKFLVLSGGGLQPRALHLQVRLGGPHGLLPRWWLTGQPGAPPGRGPG